MGSMVSVRCQCGLETHMCVGGGRLDFKTNCSFPCLCGECRDVVEVNLYAKRPECPECGSGDVVPYDDPSLAGNPGEGEVASWRMRGARGRELKLTDGSYKCPRCGRMTLRFKEYGFFD